MRYSKDQSVTTIDVEPGEDTHAILGQNGALRFARSEGSMAGQGVVSVDGSILTLSFADGTTVNIKA
ncbi:hypothetical protein [Tateyamaria omphalii]|uniref:Uncharacterized protein n=1 Tax=Tateyamaria omphalii TaxID=299262 RepID=A0A1P8N234_9RHOB|nr:hypothetical protein [Tateyamaria omphalii]APX14288.1 hypothetical protein BWR18_20785 [Tateyamaria omphalii]